MPYDGSILYAVVHELSIKLKNVRISKIYQPEHFSLIFETNSHSSSSRLLISCDPTIPRVHLTSKEYKNPSVPPMFCMLLRKHLEGGKIIEFRQLDFDRILEVDIEAMDEMGNLRIKTLHVEIMGRHSNIILIDPQKNIVIDALRRITPRISCYRGLFPGTEYIPPPSLGKFNPLKSADKLSTVVASSPSARISDLIVDGFNGISPALAESLVRKIGLISSNCAVSLSPNQITALAHQFVLYFERLKLKEFKPTVYIETHDIPKDFHIMPLVQYNKLKSITFTTINEALNYYYDQKTEQMAITNLRQLLKKSLTNKFNKALNKKQIQEAQLAETKDIKKYRIYGELITAYMYKIDPGVDFVIVDNFYKNPPEPIKIPLNPFKTPAQNAQHYFKKYNKLKNTLSQTQFFLNKTLQEIKYLEEVLYSIEYSPDLPNLLEIRNELEEGGFLNHRQAFPRKTASVKSEPYKFISSDGYVIFVGKNNSQNDELTLKKAKADDLWLHVKDIPGAHVVIFAKDTHTPEATLVEAAILAAYHSKAKNSCNVPVDYTLIKNVYKPRGARPGMVFYKNHSTLYVTPDAETVRKLIVQPCVIP